MDSRSVVARIVCSRNADLEREKTLIAMSFFAEQTHVPKWNVRGAAEERRSSVTLKTWRRAGDFGARLCAFSKRRFIPGLDFAMLSESLFRCSSHTGAGQWPLGLRSPRGR